MTKYVFLFASLTAIAFVACQEDGMKKTSTGYSYQVHRDSDGNSSEMGDHVFFIAELYNGDTLIHSSRQSPTGREHVEINEVPAQYSYFRPIMELLTLMSPGDSASLWYPVDSFPTTPAGLEGVKTVRYAISIDEVMDSVAYEAHVEETRAVQMAEMEAAKAREQEVAQQVEQVLADYKAGKLDGELSTTESGLQILVHEKGHETESVQKGDQVVTHYYGVLKEDGSMFDNSFQRGQTFPFQVGAGAVIPGWDEGFAMLNKGAKATLFIPYTLAYGKAGYPPNIPEEADLVFYVEVKDVQ